MKRPRRIMGALAVAAALCCTPAAAAAQRASLQGIVTSSDAGAPLGGVAVVLEIDGEQVYGALTGRNGFYQIGGIDPGTYSLRGQHVGHLEYEQTVTLLAGGRVTVNFELDPNPVALEGLVVSPEAGAAVRDLGRQRVTPAEIRRVPVPGGSGDLASYLQTLPGVATTGDRGGQLFVRGGTSSANLVLVDGIPIYQPFHILGFFSAFPADLISSADFYAGGFGARYSGRTSSVLDVGIRDGDLNAYHETASLSPFLAEASAEGPIATGVSWIASVRRSLVDETSGALLGTRQPLDFDDEILKVTAVAEGGLRCSALALHTSDRGQLDGGETDSYVAWRNLLVGGRCITQLEQIVRLVEMNFSFSSFDNSAVSHGSSKLSSRIWRMQYAGHSTSMIGPVPVYAGGHMYAESMNYDLTELYGVKQDDGGVFSIGGYLEAGLPIGSRIEVRPGVVLLASPVAGVEPRLRASWEPFGRSTEKVQAAFGLYRQDVVGTSDMRDVSSVFTAWMDAPDDRPARSMHALLGWQQLLGNGLQWSIEGYYKRLEEIPVPLWSAVARFTTRLGRADGDVHGVDARIEYASPHFYGFVGYGYGQTEYEVSQPEFETWFGDSVQRYSPPHDRRHQVNALANFDVRGFRAAIRWQLGTGLPFTRPLGFDEAFDYTSDLPDVVHDIGTTRLVLDRPFNARLPVMHRLDVSVGRDFDLSFGTLTAQLGAINVYDRRNMFYYDLFTGRRVDQLPFAPYLSLTLRSR